MRVMVSNQTNVEFGYLAGKYPGMIGHLYSPGAGRGPFRFMPFGADNGAWPAFLHNTEWSAEEWRAHLRWICLSGLAPIWALVPDVVGDRERTIERWHQYVSEIRAFGWRPAFALQDGMTFDDVPDSGCMLFLGGSTEWKLAAIEPWCKRFPGRVHVGRVNTWERLMLCHDAGAVSVDGTGWWHVRQRNQLIKYCETFGGEAAS